MVLFTPAKKQLVTQGQMVLSALMWPFQAFMIYSSIQAGWGYQYTLLWLLGVHVLLWNHYYDVWKGKKLNWLGPLVDYIVVIMTWFSLPLATVFCLLNFYAIPGFDVVEFAARNLAFVTWISNLEFIDVPVPERLQLDNPDHVVLIYSYTLIAFVGIVGTIPAIPLWWTIARGWEGFYASIPIWKQILIFGFFVFLVWRIENYPIFVDLVDYGFDPYIVDRYNIKRIEYKTSQLELFRDSKWAFFMCVQTVIITGALGFLQHIPTLIRTLKGKQNAGE